MSNIAKINKIRLHILQIDMKRIGLKFRYNIDLQKILTNLITVVEVT